MITQIFEMITQIKIFLNLIVLQYRNLKVILKIWSHKFRFNVILNLFQNPETSSGWRLIWMLKQVQHDTIRGFPLMFLLSLCGCATFHQTKLQKTYDSLESEINILTLDEATKRWGEPTFAVQRGNLLIVTWQKEKHWENISPLASIIYATPVTKGWELRLAFDKNTKKMLHYNYRTW